VIIDDKVVATVQWTLTEKPNQDEVYAVPAVVPGPPSLQEQECFGQLLIHFHFSDAFTLPSDSNSNIKCTTPYY
jgi:hypothetical protein